MSDWALDSSGDLSITAGKVDMVTDGPAIAQDWALRMGTILGEWFRDRNLGVDLDVMLGKLTRTRELQIRSMVRRITLQTRHIVSVQSIGLELDRKTRHLVVSAVAKLDDGTSAELSTQVGAGA